METHSDSNSDNPSEEVENQEQKEEEEEINDNNEDNSNIDKLHIEGVVKKHNKNSHILTSKAKVLNDGILRKEAEFRIDLEDKSDFMLDESGMFYRRKDGDEKKENQEFKNTINDNNKNKRICFSTNMVIMEYSDHEIPDYDKWNKFINKDKSNKKSSKGSKKGSNDSKKKKKKYENDDDIGLSASELEKLKEVRKKRAESDLSYGISNMNINTSSANKGKRKKK